MNTTTKAAVSALTLSFGAAATKGQLNFAASIAFETLPLIAANPKFKFSQFARDVEEASGYSISAKTVANCATLANQFHLRFGAKIGSYAGGHKKDNVLDFASFIAQQVASTTYKLTLEDLIAFCKGEQSSADKRAAVVQAAADAAAALEQVKVEAAAKELTATADQVLADANKAKADADALLAKAEAAKAEEQAKAAAAEAAKADAIKLAASIAEDKRKTEEAAKADRIKAAAAEAEAEALRKESESFVLKCGVSLDGKPLLTVQTNPNPAFLRQVAAELVAMAKMLEKSALKAA